MNPHNKYTNSCTKKKKKKKTLLKVFGTHTRTELKGVVPNRYCFYKCQIDINYLFRYFTNTICLPPGNMCILALTILHRSTQSGSVLDATNLYNK